MMTRREALFAAGAAAAASAATVPEVPDKFVQRHDSLVQDYLTRQVTDSANRWCGGMADATGLYHAGAASGMVNRFAAALVHPRSKYYRDKALFERMRLAVQFLERDQTPDGNSNLLITNFNSPPDTGFIVWNVAEAASIGRKYNAPEIERLLQPFLDKAGKAMIKGGIHTPNHRWVVCAAMAQIHELWPDAALLGRIDQWLAEGIDIDDDDQFTERSSIYSNVCDRSFVTMASKLKRPELLDPVRRNLGTMLYMLHPGYEVVTEISRRQDLNQRQDMGKFWFPLRAMAVWDKNGRFATIAKHFEDTFANLATILDYPELVSKGPELEPVPEDYERTFKTLGLARIRRGPTSASILLDGTSRFFTLRRGSAGIEAIRFASAFFGKGQFVPETWSKQGNSYVLEQRLEAGYYQPLENPVHVLPDNWAQLRPTRRVTELCKLTQRATVTETGKGFRVRLQAEGTDGIPLAVEIGLHEGQVTGAEEVADAAVLRKGTLTYTAGGNTIRIGPGKGEHNYIDVRGAEAKLPGRRVYLTGYTPFDHTLEIEVS